MDSCETEAVKLFRSSFQGVPTVVGRAPGRVNLLGEHTDYSMGYCLPMAIDLYTFCCLRKNPASNVTSECVSTSQEKMVATFDTNKNSLQPWASHLAGIAYYYKIDFAIQASFATQVPLGAGLSSSASLEISFAIALEQLIDPNHTWDAKSRALICVQASHEFVHVPCGILDQFASSLANENHVLFIDCLLETGQDVMWGTGNQECVLLVTNTLVHHSHASGEYTTRVLECQQASRELGVAHLRMLGSSLPSIKDLSSSVLYQRVKHVVTENARCLQARAACEAQNWVLFGRLMNESHESLAHDFQVSCPEADFLVRLAQQQQQEVFGSRMTGGGFGGCIVTLCVNELAAQNVAALLLAGYSAQFSRPCTNVIFSRPAQGATMRRLYVDE